MLKQSDKYSDDLNKMIKQREGFRNEACSTLFFGASLYDIIEYEITELNNIDIPDFLNIEYDDVEDDTLLDNVVKKLNDMILDHNNDKKTVNNYHGIWLCASAQQVSQYYKTDDDSWDLHSYEIKDDFIPISDLSDEGVLFMTPNRIN